MKRNSLAMWMLSIAAVLLVATGLVYLVQRGPQPVPQVSFTLLDGSRPALVTLRGKPVLINFWSTSCTICKKEIPNLVALHQRFGGHGLQVIAVAMSYDPPDQVVQFQHRRQLPYPISLDIDGQIALAFGGITVTPTTVLVSPRGEIVYARPGLFDVDSMAARIMAMMPGQAGS
jgi:peroxiredoxin